MNEINFKKIEEQLTTAGMPPIEIAKWIAACQRGKTVLSATGAMGHLRARSVTIYSYHAAQTRIWAIADGCPPDFPHALMWTHDRVRKFAGNHRRLDDKKAKPTHTRIALVAIERVMCAVAPDIDCRFILEEINALPRMTDDEAKRLRMQERDALWECGLGYFNEPSILESKLSNPNVTRRTGAQIASLSEWAFRLQTFMSVEIWFDRQPPDHYPRPCLTRRLGRLYVEFPFDTDSAKSSPPSQPVSDRLAELLLEYIEDPRARLRGTYAGRSLWVSSKFGALGSNGTYKQIVAKTEEVFGLSVNPHLFRDCYATSASRSEPDTAPTFYLTLGHTPQESRNVYDHSTTREAGLVMSNFSDDLIGRAKVECIAAIRDKLRLGR